MAEPSPVPGLTLPPVDETGLRGGSHPPHEASENGRVSSLRTVDRTVRVPLEAVPDAQWIILRRLAYACAAWGNRVLSEQYAKAKGLTAEWKTYREDNDVLSAAIRDAVSREVIGMWRRLGRRILRGEQTLGRFSADRALVIRDRGVRLVRDETGAYVLRLRLHPQAVDEATELKVWMPALRKDRYLRELLAAAHAGDFPITKATLQFERPGRKVYVRLAYQKTLGAAPVRVGAAEVTTEPDEGLMIRANGHRLSLADRVTRLREMKAHYAAIHARLRRDLGKRGRRQIHRRALLTAGSFEAWSSGPVHELSRAVIAWCVAEQVAVIVWRVVADGELPWDRLHEQVTYKAVDAGLTVVSPSPSQTEADPAQERELRSDKALAATQPPEKPKKRTGSQSLTRRGGE